MYLGCKYSERDRGWKMKNQEKVRKCCVCQKKVVTLRAFFIKTENGKDKLMLWQV